MIYVAITILICSIYFFVRAHKQGDQDSFYLAICLFAGAIGSGIVTFLSWNVVSAI